MGFSICIRHINCRVGLPHKISMYWNKLLMYQNMNTYIHFWNFKRNHPFFLFLLIFFFDFVLFLNFWRRQGFFLVTENYVTSASQKIPNQIKCNRAFPIILLGNNTTSHQGKRMIQEICMKLISELLLRNMTWKINFMLQLEAEKHTQLLYALYFSTVKRIPKLVKL